MTDQFILIGHPVSHSISPVIHHAAYEVLGYDGNYGLVDCADEAAVREQVERIRRRELVGANITVPWKRAAFDSADEIDASAREVGVANVLTRGEQGQIVAYNTDAIGLGAELSVACEQAQVIPAERVAVVLGSGGATRATVVACKMAGFERIAVSARRFDPKQKVSDWPNSQAFTDLGAELVPWPSFDGGDALGAAFADTGLVVQATSAGMKGVDGGEELAALLPWSSLSSGVCYDLVYTPVVTPFLQCANAEGHLARGGLGMLVGQAAHAIKIWTGQLPPSEPLTEAARKALGLNNH